jgi:hypothetical protein
VVRRALALLLLPLSGCMVNVPASEEPRAALPALAADAAAPRLALAEHLLSEYFSSDIARPPTVCLAASDGRSEEALPPADETALVARFERLAPFSRCTWTTGGWQDAESGDPALVFTIHSFSCASATECTGWASYTAGATASPSALYRMRYAGDRWQIERDQRLIMQ